LFKEASKKLYILLRQHKVKMARKEPPIKEAEPVEETEEFDDELFEGLDSLDAEE
jgi:hypothetical protein